MSDSRNDSDEKKGTPVDEALKLYGNARVFRDANRVSYVQTVAGETLAIRSEEFEMDLKARFYKANEEMLTEQEFNTVKGILIARSYAGTDVDEVHLRVAERDKVIYIDPWRTPRAR